MSLIILLISGAEADALPALPVSYKEELPMLLICIAKLSGDELLTKQ